VHERLVGAKHQASRDVELLDQHRLPAKHVLPQLEVVGGEMLHTIKISSMYAMNTQKIP
jgi:hypothetical protein